MPPRARTASTAGCTPPIRSYRRLRYTDEVVAEIVQTGEPTFLRKSASVEEGTSRAGGTVRLVSAFSSGRSLSIRQLHDLRTLIVLRLAREVLGCPPESFDFVRRARDVVTREHADGFVAADAHGDGVLRQNGSDVSRQDT